MASGTNSGNTEELAWLPLQHARMWGVWLGLQLQPPTLCRPMKGTGKCCKRHRGAHSEGGTSQAPSGPSSYREPNTGDSRNRGENFFLTEWRVCRAVGNPQSTVGYQASPSQSPPPHHTSCCKDLLRSLQLAVRPLFPTIFPDGWPKPLLLKSQLPHCPHLGPAPPLLTGNPMQGPRRTSV